MPQLAQVDWASILFRSACSVMRDFTFGTSRVACCVLRVFRAHIIPQLVLDGYMSSVSIVLENRLAVVS